jgi:uncharacterized protein YpmB
MIFVSIVLVLASVVIFVGPLFVRSPKPTTQAEREAVAANSRELG